MTHRLLYVFETNAVVYVRCIVEHSRPHSVPVKPITSAKLLFYFLNDVVLLSSCVHNFLRIEQQKGKM